MTTTAPFSDTHFGHIINGEEVASLDGAVMDDINPYTQQPWAQVALGSPADADRAVAAARLAFDHGPWPRMGFEARQKILHRLADLMDEHAHELAMADCRDMGKPITQALHDVARSAWNVRFFADHARLTAAETLPMDSGHHAYTRYESAGVVVAISPWNFPLMLGTWKVAPALAWGNTVVLKPAEDTPVSATIWARLALAAGMPPGVLNVVHGYGPDSVGSTLTADARVDRITFTGESTTGKAISAVAAANLIPVSLELGGKGANIVFDDADLDNAVHWAVQAIFRNAGQVCLAGSRLYVQRGIYDEFMRRYLVAAQALRIGDPTDATTEFGPLASQTHFRKVSGYFDTLATDGGQLLTGGVGEGWSVRPSIIVDAPTDARVCREEIFGPVVVVAPFDTEAEVIAAANDTRYGLNAMVFTRDLSRAHRVSARLHAGTIWVNCFFIRDLRAPFGGVGESGVGREGGMYSREFFTEPKAVIMQIDSDHT
ncbi:MAG: aldehyde dehydrogenase [Candidatus Nanopelagicales bacterium]|jgi:aminomuconate-semialdehyde/2-hydroxymuconate-6-semialdehyde dehydrogenase|nr:aldehyde dehydrogenase [Candidatus Nanopelagicales bacterium]MDP4824788.1 aldehyde dehydrogenase [Candidatus Nanopelagicales bacterium]MDP4888629.1 aldehyde dehydrogenase [Candidatus Nanopelagicales bacterium]